MKSALKKYRLFLFTLLVLGAAFLVDASFARRAVVTTLDGVKELLLVLPPIFVLLGLLDVWVPKDVMVSLMGDKSGFRGIFVALLLGSAAAGPLYAAFPVAAVFLKKGASLKNVFIFIGAWSTTKIPMFLFEYTSLGPRFALTRLAVDIPGIILIALILSGLAGKRGTEEVLKNVSSLAH